MTVRSSHLIFVFWEQILIFFSPVYTTQKCPPQHARKTMAARDLDCQREDRSSKFRHFSTNDRAEFTSDVRISGTSSHFFSPAYTTHKFPSDHARKTVAAPDLDYQRQGRSSKFRHFSTLTVRSSHLTFIFLYQLPIVFQQRTLHTIAFHTAQERRQRRVTLSVCAKVEFETCPNFRHCSTPTMRSSRRTFVFLYELPSFFHQHTLHASVLHTTLKRQRRRVTFTVSAKVNVCSSLILAPMTVRISHLTFLFLMVSVKHCLLAFSYISLHVTLMRATCATSK